MAHVITMLFGLVDVWLTCVVIFNLFIYKYITHIGCVVIYDSLYAYMMVQASIV